ncbi:TFIIB-type zinc ribbon-containing protein, partial [Natronomonas sp. LN261]|uniref:TFIIB-type zinc ribbon-containing protein n=1 Tax=Natronomonas sp. LN261 TaxID=2750669 RepID=UPI00272E5E6A
MSNTGIRTYNEESRTERTEQTDSTEDVSTCPECNARLEADSEHGETVCTECGLVVEEDEIDRGPEWRAFDSAEKDQKSRVGAP